MPGGGARGRWGSILEPLRHHFGPHFGLHFHDFWYTVLAQFLHHFLVPFWPFLGPILVSFWKHFGARISLYKVLRFRARPREAPATATGSKSLIFIGVLFKIEGRPFRVGVSPGAVLDANMEPKRVRIVKKVIKNTSRKSI